MLLTPGVKYKFRDPWPLLAPMGPWAQPGAVFAPNPGVTLLKTDMEGMVVLVTNRPAGGLEKVTWLLADVLLIAPGQLIKIGVGAGSASACIARKSGEASANKTAARKRGRKSEMRVAAKFAPSEVVGDFMVRLWAAAGFAGKTAQLPTRQERSLNLRRR